MTTPQDKAAEVLRIAGELERGLILGYLHIATLLREYAALLQAQPAEAGVVHVCPTRDIECGSNPASWCESCPKRPAEAGGVPPLYLHKRSGGMYRVLCRAKRESDGGPLVIYQSVTTGVVWARPSEEFDDGRFEPVLPKEK